MTAVVYRDATIFDGTGAAPSAGMSLVVDGDRVVDVAETGRLVVPDGAEVVDLAGRFVIPGLVDAHQHLATPPDRVKAEAWLRQMATAASRRSGTWPTTSGRSATSLVPAWSGRSPVPTSTTPP